MPTILSKINDYIAKRSDAGRIIDLSSVFAGEGLTFTFTNSNDEVIEARLEGNSLILDYQDTLGHSDLRITATDADGQSVTENVRVRLAGEDAYTIAVLPDTQNYTNAGREYIFKNMTTWLVENKESLGLEFVLHVGDITTDNSDTAHWPFAEPALRILDGHIPYSLAPGNHDQNTGNAANYSTDPLDTRFSPEKQAATNPGTFGGVYDMEPDRSANNYHTFTAPDGTKWMVMSLEFGARADVVRWADEVIEDHLDHRVILVNHSYMNWAGRHDATGAPLYDEGTGYDYGMGNLPVQATDGETLYRDLIQKHSNVSFTFSGHIFGDGAETLLSYDQFGNPVYQMMVNYQNGVSNEITSNGFAPGASGSNGGNGAIRLLTIDPETNQVYTSTYFTELDDYLDSNRGSEELDRDGLTGTYKGHEEILHLDVGTPELVAIAKAGNDQQVQAEVGAETAQVTLNGAATLNPAQDSGLTHVWTDAQGHVVAQGATPVLELEAGSHQFTLTVTDSQGRQSTDLVHVTVSNDKTLLVDNFNDGNADGWGLQSTSAPTKLGTTADFGIATLPQGQPNTTVTKVNALDQANILHIAPSADVPAGTMVKSYTLGFDILVPAGQSRWTSLLQTDLSNNSDGELFLRADTTTGSLGTNGNYEGAFEYGAWQRVVFTIEDRGTSVLIGRYIDGVHVGNTVQSGSNYARYAVDLSKGIAILSDEDGETTDAYLSSVMFVDKVLTGAEVTALGGTKADGFFDTPPTAQSVEIDFGTAAMADKWGNAQAEAASAGISTTGSFLVKGSAASRSETLEGQAIPEGRVFQQSDSADNILIWKGTGAQNWNNYSYETTLHSTDNDGIGLVFYHRDAQNHYRVELDGETNSRSLIKVQEGVETVLAQTHGGTPWSRDFQIKVVTIDDQISVFMDGTSLFGEVTVANPLTGGTVGFYSNNQRSSQFDNVTVNPVTLTAHARVSERPYDVEGAGKVTVTLSAEGSYGLEEIVSYVWTDAEGRVVARGETAEAEVTTLRQTLTLTVTDASGATATEQVTVDPISSDRILLSETFSGDDFSAWTIVDEGEMGGVGADGTQSQWELRDGALVQMSDLHSRHLTWGGASVADPWNKGWSPLGDGVNVLRKGTYALYNDPAAKEWKDYAVETTLNSPDNGALGLMFYYQDADNYYKLELDANGDYDRNPRNGAGSLFQLIQVKDGVETFLNQFPAKYSVGQDVKLRVEVKNGEIQAFVDGMALLAYPIENHSQTAGTIGLYSWHSAGVSFDDVTVYDLSRESSANLTLTGGADDDVMTGGRGHDVIRAGAGDDVVHADHGDDRVEGGAGDDRLYGDAGDDSLSGGAGDDRLYGGSGDDRLEGGAGDDLLEGGLGHDLLIAGSGTDELFGGAGDDTLDGGSGEDLIEGGAGHDLIDAGSGDDVIAGGAGDDTLDGGSGDDQITGGAGDDVLTGGSGRDSFHFASGFGHDTIRDFRTTGASADLLVFSADLFADYAAVMETATQVEGGVVLTVDETSSLELEGLRLSSLSQDDFRFV